jgi:hypothetical protein
LRVPRRAEAFWANDGNSTELRPNDRRRNAETLTGAQASEKGREEDTTSNDGVERREGRCAVSSLEFSAMSMGAGGRGSRTPRTASIDRVRPSRRFAGHVRRRGDGSIRMGQWSQVHELPFSAVTRTRGADSADASTKSSCRIG